MLYCRCSEYWAWAAQDSSFTFRLCIYLHIISTSCNVLVMLTCPIYISYPLSMFDLVDAVSASVSWRWNTVCNDLDLLFTSFHLFRLTRLKSIIYLYDFIYMQLVPARSLRSCWGAAGRPRPHCFATSNSSQSLTIWYNLLILFFNPPARVHMESVRSGLSRLWTWPFKTCFEHRIPVSRFCPGSSKFADDQWLDQAKRFAHAWMPRKDSKHLKAYLSLQIIWITRFFFLVSSGCPKLIGPCWKYTDRSHRNPSCKANLYICITRHVTILICYLTHGAAMAAKRSKGSGPGRT